LKQWGKGSFVHGFTIVFMSVLLFVAPMSAFAAGLVVPNSPMSIGTTPTYTVSGDFNNDGNADVAASNPPSNTVSVLLGHGDGTFDATANYSVSNSPSQIITGDFNSDLVLDLAVTTSGSVSILMGSTNGDGTFQLVISFNTTGIGTTLTSGDFNKDGNLDLAIASEANILDHEIEIRYGDGDGTFDGLPSVTYSFSEYIAGLTVGDFDGNGILDLVLGMSGSMSIMPGEAGGTFLSAITLSNPATALPYVITPADFDGDGNLDLASANDGSGNVSVMLGNGDGTLQPPTNYFTGPAPLTIDDGDFDGDGILDLAISNIASDDVSLLLGNGDGTFQAADNYAGVNQPYGLAVADFNKDGKSDFMVTSISSNTAVLYTSVPSTGQLNLLPALSTNENSGSVMVTVTRDSASSGVTSVVYSTSNGTAVAGVNYTASTGTLLFRDGETSKSFTIPIIDDGLYNGNKTVNVALSNPKYGVTLGTSSAILTIAGNMDTMPPGWPGGSVLSITGASQTGVTLSWPAATDNDAVIGYEIYNGLSPTPIATLNNSTFTQTIGGLTAGTSYTFNIKAVDAAGNASTSLVQTTTTLAYPTPSNPSLSANANLSALNLLANEHALALTPLFSASTLQYTAVTDSAQAVIQAVPSDTNAVVRLQGDILGSGKTVSLDEGDNSFRISVQAANGTIQTYTLTVHRTVTPEEPTTPTTCSFMDLEGHWAKAAVCEAASLGIIKGISATIFQPDTNVTREAFVLMLTRAMNISSDPVHSSQSFPDVNDISEESRAALQIAIDKNIITGYPDGTFRPQGMITRTELAAMLARAMKWSPVVVKNAVFADDASIPVWAQSYVRTVQANGLLQGREGNRFVPHGITTRAEAVVVMLRLRKSLDEPQLES
jgi:hypothetical protein